MKEGKRKGKSKGYLVDNGICHTSTGYRMVALSPDGEVRPVLYAVRSGYRSERCTVQVAYPGDLLFYCSWGSRDEEYGIKKLISVDGRKVKLPPEDAEKLWKEMLSDELKEWLTPQSRGESYLPDGYGWDGEHTLADRRKEDRIRRFFAGAPSEWVDKLVEAAGVTKGKYLVTSWKDAGPLPAIMDAYAYHWSGSMVDYNTYTEWVLWYKDGRVEVVQPEPTSGQWGSNYAHTESGYYDAPAQPIPEGVEKAAKVTWGAYTRDCYSYGVKWELFDISKNREKSQQEDEDISLSMNSCSP